MSKKKSTNESIKWCIAGALLVLLAMMIQKAYVTITSPLGIAELYAFEYLAMDPEGERCETCVDTLLYWDADTPTDCTLAKVMYPEGIGKTVSNKDVYELEMMSVQDWLVRKGSKPYVFELNAYRLFEQYCWPEPEVEQIGTGSIGSGEINV